jgi:hypothetical protein
VPDPPVRRIFAGASWRSVAAVITALGTVAGIVAVATDLWPDSTSCPQDKATLETPTKDAGTLERFLTTVSSANDEDPTEGYSEAQLSRRVKWLSVPVDVQGYRGEELTLKWSLGEEGSVGAVTLTSDTCASRELEHLLLDPPIPAGRTILVRLHLQDEAGQTLDQKPVSVKG